MTTPAEFSLHACAAFGVRIRLDGDDLIYEADYAPVPRALLDKLARDKAEIIALLRQGENSSHIANFWSEKERTQSCSS